MADETEKSCEESREKMLGEIIERILQLSDAQIEELQRQFPILRGDTK